MKWQIADVPGADWIEMLDKTKLLPRDESSSVAALTKASSLVLIIGSSVLIGIGIPGNILSIMVLCKNLARDRNFYTYLISLCVCNISTLTFAIPRHFLLSITGSDLFIQSESGCFWTKWVTYTNLAVTGWHLVVMSLCRLLQLIDSTRWCYSHTEPLVVIVGLIFVLALLIFVLLKKSLVYKRNALDQVSCSVVDTKWALVIQFVFAACPSLLIIVINCVMLSLQFVILNRHDKMHTKKVRNRLIILVAVSSLEYSVTVLPVGIIYMFMNKLFDMDTAYGRAKASLCYNISVIMLYLENVTNLLIYCWIGRRFRAEMFKLLKRCCCRAKRPEQHEHFPSESSSSEPCVLKIYVVETPKPVCIMKPRYPNFSTCI